MKAYLTNIEKVSKENENFREVLYTDKICQLVLMSLVPKEEIGEEVHDVDQFLRIEQGSGVAILDDITHEISQGSVLIVPAGVKHNLINTGADSMKLYTLYMPPHHRQGTVHKTKTDAMLDTGDVFETDGN